MTRVLLIGHGAREHAIAAALHRAGVSFVSRMVMRNPGIASLSETVSIGDLSDVEAIEGLSSIDYAVVGPEQPLSEGVADALESREIPCVGPRKAVARIETSKIFARELLSEVAPSAIPAYVVAHNASDVETAIVEIGLERIVVKPDGLTGGKGVRIFGEHLNNKEDVLAYAQQMIARDGGVVLEERLEGTEFTVQSFVDGRHVVPMPLVRDYKRAYDDDKGPNTGSMGSYSQADHGLDYLSKSDIESALSIMRAAIDGLRKRTGLEYKGILYGQFMKTSAGVKVIEFNARFGDPEAMNVLTIMKTSADDMFQSIIDGHVKTPQFDPLATVCVYVVPEGYPGAAVVRDAEIRVPDTMKSHLYYASVYERNGKVYTTGSRSIGILATGTTVADAREQAYEDVRRVGGRVRYRTDIAKGV